VEDLLLATLLLIGIAVLILLVAAGFIAWRVYRSDERRLARRIGKLGVGDKIALGRALYGDPRVPLWAKVLAMALVLYLASPIDLLPDFIPVIGFLDDLLIVMAGAGLLLRAVPAEVIEEHIRRFEERDQRPPAVGSVQGPAR
jgi:uncharacterized membrane protein YkvA (DUF1232 family)